MLYTYPCPNNASFKPSIQGEEEESLSDNPESVENGDDLDEGEKSGGIETDGVDDGLMQ